MGNTEQVRFLDHLAPVAFNARLYFASINTVTAKCTI